MVNTTNMTQQFWTGSMIRYSMFLSLNSQNVLRASSNPTFDNSSRYFCTAANGGRDKGPQNEEINRNERNIPCNEKILTPMTDAADSADSLSVDAERSVQEYYTRYAKIFSNDFASSSGFPSSSARSVFQDEAIQSDTQNPFYTSTDGRHVPEIVNRSLSHVDEHGRARMVDVGNKDDTHRTAVAMGRVCFPDSSSYSLVVANRTKKGDVLAVAQLAGIMAAKRTSELIPLCHNIALSHISLEMSLDDASRSVLVHCTVATVGNTGVEMEAMVGASVAALTIYDMCKSASHRIVIEHVRLVKKSGGKSGTFEWKDHAD